MKRICIYLLIFLLSWTVESCGDRIETSSLSRSQPISGPISTTKLAEVAPPTAIDKLRRAMDQYEPQVTIISPKKDEIFQENTVKVQIKVQNLPIFKDSDLELGPHLTLILDNQPSQAVYDINEPVVLESLTPGTHTLRVFASRPWYESFKNEGAYAQTTFHIYTENGNNTLNPSLPLLTYNRPRGTYGAEPILLDFYLTNAPLHVIAQENPDIADWRIKATINGESFLLNDWQSIYLKGFQKGENWVQLEFIDEKGNKVENNYNNTVRIITYDPDYDDSLTKLVKGEIPIEVAKTIVDPNYVPKQPPVIIEPEPVAEEEKIPETSEEPIAEPEPVVIEKEEPQITIEIPPTLEQPEDTLPELIEQPTVPEGDKPVPEIILNDPETVAPTIPEVIVPFSENPLEKEPPTTPQSKWIDKLLKPFPLQKGNNTDTLPKGVEEPKILIPEPSIQPQPLPPNPEPSFDFNKPVNPQIEQPGVPKFDNQPRKAAIPKFI